MWQNTPMLRKIGSITSGLIYLLLTMTATAKPDQLVELSLGGGGWIAAIEGEFGASEPPITAKELGIEEEMHEYYWTAIEHNVPILPYIKIAMLNYGHNANTIALREFDLGDTTYPIETVINTNIDLSYLEATLYYPVIDSWMRLDLGLTAREYDSRIIISAILPETPEDGETPVTGETETGETTEAETEAPDTEIDAGTDTDSATDGEEEPTLSIEEFELSGVVPLVFMQAIVDLPISNWYLTATTNFAGFYGNQFIDWEAKVGYRSASTLIRFGIELGYRQTIAELEELDDLSANYNISGPFAGVSIIF